MLGHLNPTPHLNKTPFNNNYYEDHYYKSMASKEHNAFNYKAYIKILFLSRNIQCEMIGSLQTNDSYCDTYLT